MDEHEGRERDERCRSAGMAPIEPRVEPRIGREANEQPLTQLGVVMGTPDTWR